MSQSLAGLELRLGAATLQVEIANTDNLRKKGLSGRTELSEGTGMLFVYETPQILHFWMKNTTLPLSIAFFDQNRILLHIYDMPIEPKNAILLPIYSSIVKAKYALEVPIGWFYRNNIGPGEVFYFPDRENSVQLSVLE